MKRTIPLVLVFTLGVIYFFAGFFSNSFSVNFLQQEIYANWLKIVGTFAIIMSVTSLWRRNYIKIKRKAPGYVYNYIELIGMVVMASFAVLLPKVNIGAGMVLGGIEKNSVFNWIFMNIQVPMQATMFSMLAFYIASAAYRAFRARNIEATLLLITAAIVMIGRVPLGENIYQAMSGVNSHFLPEFHWAGIFDFQGITQWILDIPNTASKRAIVFGVAMGGIATSLKIVFGIEKSWLGGTE